MNEYNQQRDLLDKILKASNHISNYGRRGYANTVLVSGVFYEHYKNLYKMEERDRKIDEILDDKQLRYDRTYLEMALKWSSLSQCGRKKVGALIVKNGMIISDGFNGTPSGMDNCCEDDNGNTNWFVIHAECNAILKCAKWGNSCDGATIYQTHSPCKECSKMILQAGINRLVYVEDYKDSSGLDFLRESGIKIDKIEI